MISQFVFVYLPGRQPFNFYLCRQNITLIELNNTNIKINWQLVVVQAASVVIHILVTIKIKFHKMKEKSSVHVISKQYFKKAKSMTSINNQTISDFWSNAFNVIIFATTGIITTVANRMNLTNVNIYPYYLLFYFYNFIFPSLLAATLSLVFYFRYAPLRKAITREIKSQLGLQSVK